MYGVLAILSAEGLSKEVHFIIQLNNTHYTSKILDVIKLSLMSWFDVDRYEMGNNFRDTLSKGSNYGHTTTGAASSGRFQTKSN